MRTRRLTAALGGACATFALVTIATSCGPNAVVSWTNGLGPVPPPVVATNGPGGHGPGTATPTPTGTGQASPPAASGEPAPGSPAHPGTRPPAGPPADPIASLPHPTHVVIVVLEDNLRTLHRDAPYLASLAARGSRFVDATALSRASEPNYLALFSGSTQDITDDSCPYAFDGANLASVLAGAGKTFTGYAESMPTDGYTGCSAGTYARIHNPWVNFTNVPASANLTFASFPQGNFADLPTVSFVIPDLCHDMQNCSVATGDAWLKANLGAYATWAQQNNSLLIVTAAQSQSSTGPNRVPLLVVGGPVGHGVYDEPVTHLSVLRTIEDMYGLPCLAKSCDAAPITDIWHPTDPADSSDPDD